MLRYKIFYLVKDVCKSNLKLKYVSGWIKVVKYNLVFVKMIEVVRFLLIGDLKDDEKIYFMNVYKVKC